MAKQTLQLGDKNTTDIRLQIISPTAEEDDGSLIFGHSQVLKNAEFFETKLSERWSSDKRPFEIKVTSSHGVENFMKCIQVMYSYYADEGFSFSSMDEALAILPVASEVMFHECLKECMLYLDAIRWSAEQNVQLRTLLSSLQINPLTALAARLGINQQESNCGGIEIFKESLQELLSLSRNGPAYRNTVEKHMLDYFEPSASPAVKDACRYAFLQEFNVNVDILKSKSDENNIKLSCSALLWVIGLIQRFDRKSFEIVLKLFCEDTDLRDSITTRLGKCYNPDILNILINFFLKAMGSGDIITPASFRVAFLTNWVHTMAALISSYYSRYTLPQQLPSSLEKGIADVAETLPLVEQRLVYTIWRDAFAKKSMSISNAVNWWTNQVMEVESSARKRFCRNGCLPVKHSPLTRPRMISSSSGTPTSELQSILYH